MALPKIHVGQKQEAYAALRRAALVELVDVLTLPQNWELKPEAAKAVEEIEERLRCIMVAADDALVINRERGEAVHAAYEVRSFSR
jgi:hypothetical protein